MSDERAFQAAGKQQGDWFEESSQRVLEDVGFSIDARRVLIADAGVEVDIIATNRQQISFYFTCKGSWRGARPGARRTDTFKKAVAEALMLHSQGWGPVVLLTSHKPDTPAGRAMLANVDPEIMFDVIEPFKEARRLAWLATASEQKLRQDLQQRRSLFQIARPHRGFLAYQQALVPARW
jgi:hypothetical protein